MYTIDLENQDTVELIFFPGGEPHAKVKQILDKDILIRANIRGVEDWMSLLVLLDALYREDKVVFLAMPYFPGARQDRVTSPGSPVTVEVYARALAHYVRVLYVFDLHSEQARAIIKNYIPKVIEGQLGDLPKFALPLHCDCIIVPDKGAVARAEYLRLKRYPTAQIVYCEKVRDPATGAIIGTKLPELPNVVDFILADDICDGGATFNAIADLFIKVASVNARLTLMVSHGIFSKGVDHIHPRFRRIITTDSFFFDPFQEISRVEIIPLDFMYANLAAMPAQV